MNESELIQAARGGNEAAFEQLVRLHEKKIYNLCLRMCGSSEDAAEAAQDTFLALWRGLEGFREDAALSTALPEDYRRVLGLRELHQLSYAEICEVTELELGTVKSRINRARLLLRNYLAADGNFFEKPASKVTECNQTVGGERNAI